jgi:hypothetical protein
VSSGLLCCAGRLKARFSRSLAAAIPPRHEAGRPGSEAVARRQLPRRHPAGRAKDDAIAMQPNAGLVASANVAVTPQPRRHSGCQQRHELQAHQRKTGETPAYTMASNLTAATFGADMGRDSTGRGSEISGGQNRALGPSPRSYRYDPVAPPFVRIEFRLQSSSTMGSHA